MFMKKTGLLPAYNIRCSLWVKLMNYPAASSGVSNTNKESFCHKWRGIQSL